nr:Cof-type HAD-IIB family hydrolase [Neobacillus sp. Marseille-Q6967]
MKYSLLATDLDGTLLNEDKEIDKETIQAIHEFRTGGGRVIICTGRSPLAAGWIAETIHLLGEPIIAYNGAIILDEDRQLIEEFTFKQNTVLKFLELCREGGIYAHFYEGDNILIPEENQWNRNWVENNILPLKATGGITKNCERYRKQCGVNLIDNVYDYIKIYLPAITKIAVFHENNTLFEFAQKLKKELGGLEVSSSFNYQNLELSPKGVSKSSALVKVADKLKIPLSEVAAIGDNFNDILMLKTAGLGIAMGNAPEDVKLEADVITDNNDNLGVAKAIHNYLLS